MPRIRSHSFAERCERLRKRVPTSAAPVVSFVVLLVMGVIMLYPGRYHDGAAGRTVCAIAGVGLGWFGWSWLRRALEVSLSRRRRRRGGG